MQEISDSLSSLRDYPAVIKACDTLLDMTPDDQWAIAMKSSAYQAMGNLAAAAALLPQQPDDTRYYLFLSQVQQRTYERQPGQAIAALQAALSRVDKPAASYQRLNMEQYLIFLYHETGQTDAARASALQYQKALKSEYRADELYGTADTAITFAFLGDKARAIATLEPLRTINDATLAAGYAEALAIIGLLTGDKELALAQLALSAQTPAGIDYGDLLFNPLWDPLRRDPLQEDCRLAQAKNFTLILTVKSARKSPKTEIVCAYPRRRIIAMRRTAPIDNGAGSSGSMTGAPDAEDAIRVTLNQPSD